MNMNINDYTWLVKTKSTQQRRCGAGFRAAAAAFMIVLFEIPTMQEVSGTIQKEPWLIWSTQEGVAAQKPALEILWHRFYGDANLRAVTAWKTCLSYTSFL